MKAWEAKAESIGDADKAARWSWDNAILHGKLGPKSSWTVLGITQANHTQIPPYSPDMHFVIESSHGLITTELQKFVNEQPPQDGDPLELYTAQLQAAFKKQLTPDWGAKCVRHLFRDVLPAILVEKGNYPSKNLR